MITFKKKKKKRSKVNRILQTPSAEARTQTNIEIIQEYRDARKNRKKSIQ